MKRPTRVKGAELDEAGFASVLVHERERGTGSRDRKTVNGHVYERARVYIVNSKGVRQRKEFYAKTKRELERKVAKALETPARTAEASKMTVEAYFRDRFLPGARPTIRPATYASYLNAVDNRIAPMLGKAKFATLTADNVRAWVLDMKQNGKGDRADQIAVAILKRGYARALEDGLLISNPIGHVKLPKAEMREQYILNLKETIHFLRTLRLSESRYFPLMYCAISLGMRESELFGLLRPRVDFTENRVRVLEQAGPLADGTLGQVPLKTKASQRTLHLDASTVRALHLQDGLDPTLVFPGPRGGYLRKGTMCSTIFPALLKQAGLPTDGRLWFHLLRHSAESMLSAANVSTPKIDKWSGHATSGIAGKYILIHDEDLAEVAGIMERLLSPVWAEVG